MTLQLLREMCELYIIVGYCYRRIANRKTPEYDSRPHPPGAETWSRLDVARAGIERRCYQRMMGEEPDAN